MNPASRLRIGLPFPLTAGRFTTEGQPVAALATIGVTMQSPNKPRLIPVTADEAARLNLGKAWEPPVWNVGGKWYGEQVAVERWREQQGTKGSLP